MKRIMKHSVLDCGFEKRNKMMLSFFEDKIMKFRWMRLMGKLEFLFTTAGTYTHHI